MVCQRRFWWRHVKDLTTKTRSTPLEFGGAIHAALNVWFKNSSAEGALMAFKKAWEAVGGDYQDDQKRTLAKGERILKGYIAKYAQEPFTVLANEKSFQIVMPNGLTYIGRRDRVVNWQGAIYVMEHKTMSQLGYTSFDKFKPNLQIDGYIYEAAKNEYPQCHGCVVDAILVAKTKEEYARKIETRTAEEINNFPELFQQITESIQNSLANDHWVPNYEMCTYYGQCPYRTLCMQPKALWDRIASTEYVVSHWDPRITEEGGGD
jgi:hypothetical protein